MQKTANDLWNAKLYDEKHIFVSNYGTDVTSLLEANATHKILDVGCGTGDLANEISKQAKEVVGVDFSPNMIAQAQRKYPHISFAVADAKQLPFEAEFDAIFSNATLHWIKEPEQAIASLYKSLKSGGKLVAEFGGAGNVKKITDALIEQIRRANIPYTDEQFPWYFPTIGQYTALLEQYGFEVNSAWHFDRPTKLEGENGLRNWLQMFSPSLFEHVTDEIKQQVFTQTVESLRPQLYINGEWFADYRRLRIVATKK